MGAHNYAYAAIPQTLVNLPALLLGAAAGEECTTHAGGCKIFTDIRKVLLCKHFGRRHDASLEAVVYSKKGAEHGNHGLSGTHVSLQ